MSKSVRTAALKAGLDRSAEVSKALTSARDNVVDAAGEALAVLTSAGGTGGDELLLEAFYQRLGEVREYHARHDTSSASNSIDPSIAAALGAPMMPVADTVRPYGPSDPVLRQQEAQGQAHALLSSSKKKRKRRGDPAADGYDLHSLIKLAAGKVRGGDAFSPEEVMGKYLDLTEAHAVAVGMKHVFATAVSGTGSKVGGKDGDEEKKEDDADHLAASQRRILYADLLALLSSSSSLASLPESAKLKERKKYARFLSALFTYLSGFLGRTSPFLDVESEVVKAALSEFDREWAEKGGIEGWECREAEKIMASMGASSDPASGGSAGGTESAPSVGIDLGKYSAVEQLHSEVDADVLKAELARLGLKCGGAPLDRAKRLWLLKDKTLEELPKKAFAKGRYPPKKKVGGIEGTEAETKGTKAEGASAPASASGNDSDSLPLGLGGLRRIDLARLEYAAVSLLDQVRPALDGTSRRAERRFGQTVTERERELEEEINGAKKARGDGGDGDAGDGTDDDSDDDDAPIYNPKGVPLGWDGKPIPYWLFKLHGLNHFYPCEICGGESYRGRRNFEKHFAESRHTHGMRCLGIPNTRHFHGVTGIEDARKLWGRLRGEVEEARYDPEREEEYEDSHGNVMNRKTYEDLARQGLL